jgi:hypothetical protein
MAAAYHKKLLQATVACYTVWEISIKAHIENLKVLFRINL